jgi:hypothetical protein
MTLIPGVKTFDRFAHWKNQIDERDWKTAGYNLVDANASRPTIATGVTIANLFDLLQGDVKNDIGFVKDFIFMPDSVTNAYQLHIRLDDIGILGIWAMYNKIPVNKFYPFKARITNNSAGTFSYSFYFVYLPKSKVNPSNIFSSNEENKSDSLENLIARK